MRIYTDLDSVLNRLTPAWLKLIKEQLGEDIAPEELTSWERLSAKKYQDLLSTPDLFLGLEMEPGAETIIPLIIAKGHHLFVVSAAGPHNYRDKHRWIKANLPCIDSRNIMFAYHKEELAQPGRILIDDGMHNIDAWQKAGGTGIIYDQPWNRGASGLRLCHWEDLRDMLQL